ncbi:hypothetical protein ACVC7V_01580 [Hydrogenophaga sp. A37]|uniref:hypothetical protein n=1 Tax=Hydrogenophaga sp. A37 TaxID=1945864 RepID=UPI000986E3AB|nr:hypothetical protein [Hydrogenophaga sp. A37]OOG87165.1 hypothetical protein B0E41_04235 [Hydrogenophaga sp. A37]
MVLSPTLFRPIRAAAGLALLLALAACAVPTRSSVEPDAVTDCRRWLERLDDQVDAQAVRDGGAASVPSFRFLRVDRLLSSFHEASSRSEAQWQAWGARLLTLDAQARAVEIDHLSPPTMALLAVPDQAAAKTRVRDCGERLWAATSADATQRERLRKAAQVPDDYSVLMRTLGVYPLSRLPFFGGVEREQRHWQARWAALAARSGPAPGWMRYQSTASPLSAAEAGALARAVPRDALGIPQPDETTAQRLLQAFAPALEIDTRGAFDRPGMLRWAQGPAPEVNTGEPVVYQRIAHTRHGDQTLMQLVYSVWFTERPARSGMDLLAGRVDAVVLRLTLSGDGRVLMLDSIHGCGCYHLFVPTPAMALKPAPEPRVEWAFVPATLPAMPAGQRLRVRLSSGDHEVVGVGPDPGGADAVDYALVDEDGLRSLPTPDGGRRSAFWSNGIMPGTERGERALFWPMGIESPGAMRQWGRHPTAFVGRRHFDDARLLEQRFELKGQPAMP